MTLGTVYATFSRRVSFAAATLWLLLLWWMLETTRPVPLDQTLVGALLGVAAGYLRLRAILSDPPTFFAAKTASDLRHALIAVRPGKYSVALLWANGIGQLLWAMALAPDMFIGAWVAAVAAFGLTRHIVPLSAISGLGCFSKTAG